jgi:hypothetical protein
MAKVQNSHLNIWSWKVPGGIGSSENKTKEENPIYVISEWMRKS